MFNEELYEKIYVDCKRIIELSDDKNIKSKTNKLEQSYKMVIADNDWETQEFHSIVLELFVYDFLRQKGYNVYARADKNAGPDFYSMELGNIECVSLTMGEDGTEGREYLEQLLNGMCNRYKAVFPRMSTAIAYKREKYNEYIKRGIVIDNPRIICVGTAVFSSIMNSDLMHDVIRKILYGIGDQTFTFDMSKHEFIDNNGHEKHVFDDKIIKNGKIPLEYDYFHKEEYRDISAIMLINSPIGEPLTEKHCTLYLNSRAKYPLDYTELEGIKCFYQVGEDEYHIS